MEHFSIHSRVGAGILAVAFAVPLPGFAASSGGWLQARDQNPFALASGLPLAPAIPHEGRWQFDATFNVANTELAQFRDGASMVFDAETHESRIGAAYAFNDRWSLRASLGYLTIGDGFLDAPVERFHRAFGFDNGDRGQLGTEAPAIEVRDAGVTRYALDKASSGSGPLLIDLTRRWQLSDQHLFGIALGGKLATGSVRRLTDSDSSDVSLSAFSMMAFGERLDLGMRAGMLLRSGNHLLAEHARDQVPFAGIVLRYRLGDKWSAWLQSDAHGALYCGLPDFLGSAANQLNFGLSRRLGSASEFQFTVAEDLPALHSSDVAVTLNWRLRTGQ